MRCFLSISLENISETLKKIELPREDNMNLAKRYHITLNFWENLPENILSELLQKLDLFKFKKFNLQADKILAFPNKNKPELYALGFSNSLKLEDLHKKLATLLSLHNKDNFSPHITLMRKEKLSQSFKNSKELLKSIKPINIKIKEFGLYKSEPEKGMNTYTPLKIVKLD
jgi:2'-5' RNA ligase